MSQVQGGRVDLCDNPPSPDDPAAQHRNLNETNALTQSQSDERGRDELILNSSLNNNGGEGHRGRSREDEEEEDNDEVMKEEEEEVESEESSCLICCHSPDTPMTDSSYSETGKMHRDIDAHGHTLTHSLLQNPHVLLSGLNISKRGGKNT